MVWAAFCTHGKLNLVFTSSKMNSKDYQNVLESSLLPFLRKHRSLPLVFQQDNAAIHVSNDTKKWFERNKIKVLDWPARSPDCNPVENVWGIIVRRIYADAKTYDSVNSLKVAISEAWEQLEPTVLKNLVDSMSNRVFEVINKNGGVINY